MPAGGKFLKFTSFFKLKKKNGHKASPPTPMHEELLHCDFIEDYTLQPKYHPKISLEKKLVYIEGNTTLTPQFSDANFENCSDDEENEEENANLTEDGRSSNCKNKQEKQYKQSKPYSKTFSLLSSNKSLTSFEDNVTSSNNNNINNNLHNTLIMNNTESQQYNSQQLQPQVHFVDDKSSIYTSSSSLHPSISTSTRAIFAPSILQQQPIYLKESSNVASAGSLSRNREKVSSVFSGKEGALNERDPELKSVHTALSFGDKSIETFSIWSCAS